jgi:hypothetical protein
MQKHEIRRVGSSGTKQRRFFVSFDLCTSLATAAIAESFTFWTALRSISGSLQRRITRCDPIFHPFTVNQPPSQKKLVLLNHKMLSDLDMALGCGR